MQPTPLTSPLKTKMKYQIQIPFEILEKAYTIFATSFINRIVDDSKIADDYPKYFGDINRIYNDRIYNYVFLNIKSPIKQNSLFSNRLII